MSNPEQENDFDEEHLAAKVEHELTKVDPDVFKNITPEKKREIIKAAEIVYSAHKGPLPHPEILKGYEEIVPGAANRIITTVESRVNHEIEIENKAVDFQISFNQRGQIYGILIVAMFLVATVYVSALGNTTVGIAIVSALAAVLGVFLYGRFVKNTNSPDESDKKDKQ